MAKEKFKYFKLGPKATTFVDPKSGLKIINNRVERCLASKADSSKTVKNAIEGGHIKAATEEEYNESVENLEKKAEARAARESSVVKKERKKPLAEEEEETTEEEVEEEEKKPKKKGKGKGKGKGK